MRTNQDNVIEIDLRDAFFDLLYHWRSLIIAALIGAILFGGYAWYSNQKTQLVSDPVSANTTPSVEVIPENKILKGMQDLYTIQYEANVAYLGGSILMNSDFQKEWQAKAIYAVVMDSEVSVENTEKEIAVAAAYPSFIYCDWNQEMLREIYGEEGAKYASELFSCEAVEQSGTFVVTAIGQTEEMAQTGLAYLKKTIETFSKKESQALGRHHLEMLNEYTIQVVNMEAEERLATLLKNLPTYQNGMKNAIKAWEDATTAPSPSISVKPIKMYALIGFLLGCFLLAFLYFIHYVLCGRLQCSEVIQKQHGVAIYGQFNHSRARRPGKGIDRLIEYWEFRKNRIDKTTVIKNICALLEEKTDVEILVTGTIPQKIIQSLCEEICTNQKSNVLFRVEGDILNNARAIEAANQAQSILLVEERYVSYVKDIRRMAEVLAICNTPVIGAIIL